MVTQTMKLAVQESPSRILEARNPSHVHHQTHFTSRLSLLKGPFELLRGRNRSYPTPDRAVWKVIFCPQYNHVVQFFSSNTPLPCEFGSL